MMYMDFKRKLPIPMETKEMYPLTGDMAETVERTVTELKAIFSGDSEKLALIIGPCSADNEESVIDYISRLMPLREQVKDIPHRLGRNIMCGAGLTDEEVSQLYTLLYKVIKGTGEGDGNDRANQRDTRFEVVVHPRKAHSLLAHGAFGGYHLSF